MPRSARQRIAAPCGDGERRELEMARVSTPIGDMTLCVCPVGLHMLYQKDEITDENFAPDQSVQVSLLSKPPQDEKVRFCLDGCLSWLQSYFNNVKNFPKLLPSLCAITLEGTSFRDRVFKSLAKCVPAGKTITYGELAAVAGSPGAQQAVGSAMATNPFQLIVPCHRVVKSGQMVGKYSGGCRNSVKIWLLRHEGLNVDEKGIVYSA